MDLERFKFLHKKFSKYPLPKGIENTLEYKEYARALNTKKFYEWTLTVKFKKHRFNYTEFCCMIMADKVFESFDKKGKIKYDEVDVIINKWKDGTYGIPIHDGGTSIIKINYCPWCGAKL